MTVRIALTLRLRLLLLWLFMLAVSAALAFVIRDVYQLGAKAQTERTLGLASQACATLQTEYPRAVEAGSAPVDATLMSALLNLILGELPGIEGGYWQETEGFVAYAFPTHQGSEEKKDVPSTERSRIETLARTSIAGQQAVTELLEGTRETVVLTACPMAPAKARLVAWTMARVPTATGKAYDQVKWGLALLLGFVILSGVWLGWSFYRWSSHFDCVERQLAADTPDNLHEIAPTGDAELDRIVAAFNRFRVRLQAARDREREFGARLAQTERFAALGRMAAAVAHEVRNPIAAMRLKVENALAQASGQEVALHFVLKEIERLDATVRSLLSRAQPVSMNRREVRVTDWIAERIATFGERAAHAGVEMKTRIEIECWKFDPVTLGRALDNLLANALDHTPRGGTIEVSALGAASGAGMILRVHDSGPGVASDIEPRLFEPFVSGRPNGVGLGLALVQKSAVAHGGTARHVRSPSGACFEIEIP
jgi:signal transduction histidine kinase